MIALEEFRLQFLRDWDSESLGHDKDGNHIPDQNSKMARQLHLLLMQATLNASLEADGHKADADRFESALDELLEAVKTETVILYQNRLCIIRNARIQGYVEFDKLRTLVRRLLAERGKPDPFEGPPLV